MSEQPREPEWQIDASEALQVGRIRQAALDDSGFVGADAPDEADNETIEVVRDELGLTSTDDPD